MALRLRRRTFLAGLAGVSAWRSGRPAFAQPVAPVADSWIQFRRDPLLTGVSPTPLPASLKELWSYEAGDAIDSSAAVAADVVYVGSHAGQLLGLDLATGALRFKYVTGAEIGESSPTVADGIVYVGDLAGVLHAVGAADGARRWTFKAGKEIKASPIVTEGKVLVGSYDQHLYGLDARTGALAWKVETEGPVHATAAVAGGLAFVTGCDERLRAIQIATGKQAYEIASGAYTGASPALADDGHAYYGTFDNQVLGVDLKARRIVWRYEHPVRKFPFYSSAALAEGLVVLGGRDKIVHALDMKTGLERWSFATQARIDSSPAVASGRVYVGSNDGRLYVLDLKTGAKLQEWNAGSPLATSPAIAVGRLVIGSADGRLSCLGA
jgi:outer membrane protein assembly factor BamB